MKKSQFKIHTFCFKIFLYICMKKPNSLQMKQIVFILLFSLFQYAAHAQVSDAQVSFTASLEEILYIKVKSGGNIDFVFNTIADLKNGIGNTSRVTTTLAVTSSSDYDIYLYAENANLTGTDNPANLMNVNNIGYTSTYSGALTEGTEFDLINNGLLTTLTSLNTTKLVDNLTDNYEQNVEYQILWECNTPAVQALHGLGSLLNQNKRNDRYVVNVTLIIDALP